MKEQQIKIIRQLYDAINKNEISSALTLFDPLIVRIEWEGLPTEGIYRGLPELEKHISAGRSTWAEGSCQPKDFIVSNDKIIVPVHVRVRLKGEADWIDGHIADVFTFNAGKIIEFRSFLNEDDALQWIKN